MVESSIRKSNLSKKKLNLNLKSNLKTNLKLNYAVKINEFLVRLDQKFQ